MGWLILINDIDSKNTLPYFGGATNGLLPVGILPVTGLFPFAKFNRMQSEAFDTVYESSNNCVISAPTGSGKTVLFELAIIKQWLAADSPNIKILYFAPTKTLCLEKADYWGSMFSCLGLSVGVLTSDTVVTELYKIKRANIIITTPEKWNALTRTWSDYRVLYSYVQLVLIDEIHLLNEDRGATLEVVIARLVRDSPSIRVVGLSATISNIADIAQWLQNTTKEATHMSFDESYRPVAISKEVYGYDTPTINVSFDTFLNQFLLGVIRDHSKLKPTIIFCSTRRSCVSTALYLNKFIHSLYYPEKPGEQIRYDDEELNGMSCNQVLFHHAGLSLHDKRKVEANFREGKLKLLCCTSTLAVGVNLPAYLIVIKGTQCWTDSGLKEYSNASILQMIGRAGRPQYETEGKAVILTKNQLKPVYDDLIHGCDTIESSLYKNVREHLVAEISLGSVVSVDSAFDWIASTFLYVRYLANPQHYDPDVNDSPKERLRGFCKDILTELVEENMIKEQAGTYQCTSYGLCLVRYYVSFQTMKLILKTKSSLTCKEILDVVSNLNDFEDSFIFRGLNELDSFKIVNRSPLIRYPLQEVAATVPTKVLLTIQYELGNLNATDIRKNAELKPLFFSEKTLIIKRTIMILKCMIDVFTIRKDGISANNSLLLLRCLICKCWEDSFVALTVVNGLNVTTASILANHGITTLEKLKNTSPNLLDYFCDERGVGEKIHQLAANLPDLKLLVTTPKVESKDQGVSVTLNVSIRVNNAKESCKWNKLTVNLIITTVLSTGELLDFRKILVAKLDGVGSFEVSALLTGKWQALNVTLATDCIVGLSDSHSIRVEDLVSADILQTMRDEDLISTEELSLMDTGLDSSISSYTPKRKIEVEAESRSDALKRKIEQKESKSQGHKLKSCTQEIIN